MKSKKIKCIIIVFLGIFMLGIINPIKVHAALQSNPNVHYTTQYTLSNWITLVRQMESAGNSMGLNETFKSDYTSNTSNKIDVHLIKSTEYGAIAILSASGYGNSQTLQNSSVKTTTGNKSGVYFSGEHSERVAAYWETSGPINNRYYDAYTSPMPTNAKIGDALGTGTTANPGCYGWHSGEHYDEGAQGYQGFQLPVVRGKKRYIFRWLFNSYV